jgi:hypothetical protein
MSITAGSAEECSRSEDFSEMEMKPRKSIKITKLKMDPNEMLVKRKHQG